MNNDWLQNYIQLGLRIDKVLQRTTGSWFVDYYYGPPEWKADVDTEPDPEPLNLLREATHLLDSLPLQQFETQRANYLEKQVQAIETITRKLNGETFALEEEIERCFDICPQRIPEEHLEQNRELFADAIPGNTPLVERYLTWQKQNELPPTHNHLLPDLLKQMAVETQKRTQTIIDLPEAEGVDIQLVQNTSGGAANWYLGNFHSRAEFNTDLPINLARLPFLICHEIYPGHHTESVMKEQVLYRKQHYLEQSIFLIHTPQLVIAEGIAMVALDIIFGPGEAETLLAEQFYPQAGMEWQDGVDLVKLNHAMAQAQKAWGNAVFMLREGQSDEDIIRYLMHYTIKPEERARKFLDVMKRPLMDTYAFTYSHGQHLIQPLLNSSRRNTVYRRLLTEQIYPSLLLQWTKETRHDAG
ncbi:MAG: hypothetical protein AAGF95_00265 [Chloroflexota bacterium]